MVCLLVLLSLGSSLRISLVIRSVVFVASGLLIVLMALAIVVSIVTAFAQESLAGKELLSVERARLIFCAGGVW